MSLKSSFSKLLEKSLPHPFEPIVQSHSLHVHFNKGSNSRDQHAQNTKNTAQTAKPHPGLHASHYCNSEVCSQNSLNPLSCEELPSCLSSQDSETPASQRRLCGQKLAKRTSHLKDGPNAKSRAQSYSAQKQGESRKSENQAPKVKKIRQAEVLVKDCFGFFGLTPRPHSVHT